MSKPKRLVKAWVIANRNFNPEYSCYIGDLFFQKKTAEDHINSAGGHELAVFEAVVYRDRITLPKKRKKGRAK